MLYRDGDACDPQGLHVRNVHYCSAACLFINKTAFLIAGGFNDELYEV